MQSISDKVKEVFSKSILLQSVKRVTSRPQVQYVDNLKDVGSLVYYFNDELITASKGVELHFVSY